jgi:hypothetical protein
MEKTKKFPKVLLLVVGFALVTSSAFAAKCEKTVGGKKSEFTGDSLAGLAVDKSSIPLLNKQFPQLAITEKVFSGTIQTCANCTDNYVSCHE